MPRVLVVGSANVDLTVRVPRLPRPGETVSDGALLVAFGGKGANQAVAARRLGSDVRFIGCVGDDAAGRDVRAALEAEGIDVAGVAAIAGAATGTALIIVDGAGRNQIAVAPGANRALSVDVAQARQADFAWADVVMTQLETPAATVQWVLESARRAGVITVLNPAPVPERPLDEHLWPLVDYLTPNAVEAERLTGVAASGEAGAREAAVALRARGVGTVIVTLGEAGAIAVTAGGVTQAPAHHVAVVDTTAAGDAFNAALAVGLAEHGALELALRLASATAALACTRAGAQPSLPTRADVDRLLSTLGGGLRLPSEPSP